MKIEGKDFERLARDEIRSGKHDTFLRANYGKFCLTILKEEMRQKEISERDTSNRGTTSYDPLSINP